MLCIEARGRIYKFWHHYEISFLIPSGVLPAWRRHIDYGSLQRVKTGSLSQVLRLQPRGEFQFYFLDKMTPSKKVASPPNNFPMKKPIPRLTVILIALCAVLSTPGFAQEHSAVQQSLPRPRLVVGIVVDQMRWDYLYRYFDRYQNNGFKRMLSEGFSVENTNINYVPTVTAIGHATIYTGSVPSIHGIAGNNFIDNRTGKMMYCTGDDQVQSIGTDSKAGQMSPRNLLAGTITDELKLATNFRAKVIGVALKDRGSILPAGHAADAAYWFDAQSGNWITSSWYMQKLPAWVEQFNQRNYVKQYMSRGWSTLYPLASYLQSAPDKNDYEGKFAGTDAAIFPVNTAKLYAEYGAGLIRNTPFGNSFTLDMARAAIKNEAMGKRGTTDFLAVSLSSPDYIGHQFGPNSVEAEDTYLRLDQDLGRFFTYLDKEIGKGQYTVFLSADHGAAHNISFLQDHQLPAGAWNSGAVQKALNAHLQTLFASEKIVLNLMNYQVQFNFQEIKDKALDFEKVQRETIHFLEAQDGVAYAVAMENARSAAIPTVIRERIINGYNRERSGAIQIILKPAWHSSGAARPTGASHSAWNPYDAHIPLVFMGWGIRRGQTYRSANMTDIAPTLAALLHIQPPNGSIGTPISEAIQVEKGK
jgi:predicted AlkP superfamily pyrophosphatase or phosphodiesterase